MPRMSRRAMLATGPAVALARPGIARAETIRLTFATGQPPVFPYI